MDKKTLNVQLFEKERALQDISGEDMSSTDMLSLLSMFDPYGFWRLDLNTGEVFWTRDVYEIHGLEYSEGPVDLTRAMRAYHPEDQKTVAALLEETINTQTGFRFVLRLKQAGGGYKLVKSIGRYRQRPDGREEIVGLFSQFALAMRSVATVG